MQFWCIIFYSIKPLINFNLYEKWKSKQSIILCPSISFTVTADPSAGTGGGGGGGGPVRPSPEQPLVVTTEDPYCGDGICGEGETFLNCDSDCKTQPAWAAKLQFTLIAFAALYTVAVRPNVIEKKRKIRRKKKRRGE